MKLKLCLVFVLLLHFLLRVKSLETPISETEWTADKIMLAITANNKQIEEAKEDMMKNLVAEATLRNVYIETRRGKGSGVIISTNIILTCKHLMDNLMFVDGKPATIVQINRDTDLMILSTKTREMPKVGLPEKVSQDEEVFSVSNPIGHHDLLVRGRIVDIADGMFYSDMHVFSGSSGSGVYNKKGKLIGIVSAMQGVPGMGFPYAVIVPIGNLLKMFE